MPNPTADASTDRDSSAASPAGRPRTAIPRPVVPTEFLQPETDEGLERRRWRWIVARALALPEDHPAFASCFEALWTHFGRPEAWRVFDDVALGLTKLDRTGYALAAASNFDRRLHAVRRGLPELAPLRTVFTSTDLGVRKPSGDFFHRLCRRLRCPPQRVAYVGDDPRDDVAPARRIGMPVIWLDRRPPAAASPAPAAFVPRIPALADTGAPRFPSLTLFVESLG
ncbi:MAG: HAD family hydrolase [Planctomycetota bacterium]|nr:MAG: HAD family hydrolase [Planctomycetota bacterium]